MTKEIITEAIKHWSHWSRAGLIRKQSCGSFERLYADHSERYQWNSDIEARTNRFYYDIKIAEQIEQIITSKLNSMEKQVLMAKEIYGYGQKHEKLAQTLDISTRLFYQYYDNAMIKIGKAYNKY